MPRNKIVKRTTKRKTVNNVLANIQKVEAELMKTPAKLAAHLNKNVDTHKRKEIKLKKAVNKISNILKQSEDKMKTTASKKTLKKAKKTFKLAAKTHSELDNQLQHTTDILNVLLTKQEKLASLDKYLRQFEKEWTKTSKKMKADKKFNKKSKPRTKSPDLTIVEQPNESRAESTQIDEPAEIAS